MLIDQQNPSIATILPLLSSLLNVNQNNGNQSNTTGIEQALGANVGAKASGGVKSGIGSATGTAMGTANTGLLTGLRNIGAGSAQSVINTIALEEGQKVLKTKMKDMANEMSPEQLAQSLLNLSSQQGLQTQQAGSQLISKPTYQPQQNQQTDQQSSQPINIRPQLGLLNNLLTLGGLLAGPDTRFKALRNIAAEQEIRGEQPLQKGEREKLGMEAATDIGKELAKSGNPDALTPENAGKFNLLVEGADSTANISNMLQDNITMQLIKQGSPSFFQSQQAKLLGSYIEQAVQARTRIETGAALQPSELKSTAKRYMPRAGDSLETALKRLQPLYNFFEGSLNVADPTGIHRQRIKGTSNMDDNYVQQVVAEARKRGLIK